VHRVKIEGNYQEGSIWNLNDAKLTAVGAKMIALQLLMPTYEVKWSMDELLEEAGDFAPTPVLIKMKNGTECGGFAAVPWPKWGEVTADPGKGSFIRSLETEQTRFDLVGAEPALFCTHLQSFGFGCGNLFIVGDEGVCGSQGDVSVEN
jgi:hypothetical protein